MRNICIIMAMLLSLSSCNKDIETDILIIGGGASGIAAGVQAARLGSKAVIVEESTWLGGMLTSAGVSAIDGNYNLPSGFWGEFRDSLTSHYGSLESLKTGWVSNVLFEPSVGNQIFREIASKEKNLTVWYESQLIGLEKTYSGWTATIRNGEDIKTINAKIVIDGTELGDVAKLVGVDYKIGMDSKLETGEDVVGDKPYDIIQDLTYVAILKDYKKDVTIAKPENYNPAEFACAAINDLCVEPKEPKHIWAKDMMITYGKLPNDKYMINWPIEGNDYYLNLIELSPDERIEKLKEAKAFTMQFIYFIQKELGFNNLGLADDEYPTDDLLPFIPYHRESRRIDGEVKFSLQHITQPYSQSEKLYRTAIAVGDYPVDHHHQRYKGSEKLPDVHLYPVPSYGLPLGVLIPKGVDGLVVTEKSISVTNIVNGSTRLQPVVLQVGHVAGVLSSLAEKNNTPLKDVSVREVQRNILQQGGYLLPYLDVPKEDKNFKAYQQIGVTGILRGEGKNVGWSNQTWLRVNDRLLNTELEGFTEFYPYLNLEEIGLSSIVTYQQAITLIKAIAHKENIVIDSHQLKEKNTQEISRGEFAVLVNNILNPFEARDVDLKGHFITKE